jgi:hypothetical protein
MVKLWVHAVCLYAILGWIPIVLLSGLVSTSVIGLFFGLWLISDIAWMFLGTELIDHESVLR